MLAPIRKNCSWEQYSKYNILFSHDNILLSQTKLVNGETGNEIDLADSFEYKPNEFWVVLPQSGSLPSGDYTLFLDFEGKLVGNGIVGFYKSVYVDSKTGKKHAMATSKFQPTYARRAFPCFDEPSFKVHVLIFWVVPIYFISTVSTLLTLLKQQ